jgi:hypothetical protein
MAYATLTLRIGPPETGHWCERCLLPSAFKFPVTVGDHGPLVGTYLACPDCGWRPLTPAEFADRVEAELAAGTL